MRLPVRFTAALSMLLACAAQAHDGHLLTGSHWHASDTLGIVSVAALGAAAIWLSRRGK